MKVSHGRTTMLLYLHLLSTRRRKSQFMARLDQHIRGTNPTPHILLFITMVKEQLEHLPDSVPRGQLMRYIQLIDASMTTKYITEKYDSERERAKLISERVSDLTEDLNYYKAFGRVKTVALVVGEEPQCIETELALASITDPSHKATITLLGTTNDEPEYKVLSSSGQFQVRDLLRVLDHSSPFVFKVTSIATETPLIAYPKPLGFRLPEEYTVYRYRYGSGPMDPERIAQIKYEIERFGIEVALRNSYQRGVDKTPV